MKVRTSRRSRNVVLEMEPKDSILPPVSVPELRLKRILAPVDFSECSRKALQYAEHFARQFNAELMMLHVIVTIVPPSPTVALEFERLSVEYMEEAAKQLSAWRREMSRGLSVRAVTRNGVSAYPEIIEAARESNSDLIVIGHHGRSGLSRLLIGSTAEQVVRHAPCPTLVIRQDEHDFIAGYQEPGRRS